MTAKKEIYKCEICGNIVEVLHEAGGQLVCCGQPMDLQEEKATENEGNEKHLPVIEGNTVKVGSIPHPMEQGHYLEWIEATSETGETCKIFLKPDQEPKATFAFQPIQAREYCNKHGLWKTN